MAAMKITSITIVKRSEIPETVKNTEMSQVVESLSETLRKGIPKDSGFSFKLEGAKKHTRFGLQSRLQKRGFKVKVSVAKNGLFYVQPAEA